MTLAAFHPARILIDGVYFRAIRSWPALAPAMGRAVAMGGMAVAPAWRRVLRQNARLALGPMAAESKVCAVAADMALNMQRSIADILLSQGISADVLAARISKFSGQHDYRAARAQGRGLVVAAGAVIGVAVQAASRPQHSTPAHNCRPAIAPTRAASMRKTRAHISQRHAINLHQLGR